MCFRRQMLGPEGVGGGQRLVRKAVLARHVLQVGVVRMGRVMQGPVDARQAMAARRFLGAETGLHRAGAGARGERAEQGQGEVRRALHGQGHALAFAHASGTQLAGEPASCRVHFGITE